MFFKIFSVLTKKSFYIQILIESLLLYFKHIGHLIKFFFLIEFIESKLNKWPHFKI